MTKPTLVMGVDWNNDGDFVDANEDLIGDVLSLECRRGRDYASQLTGRSVAGRLSAVLNNSSGKYSPFNSAGALYGSLLPGRRVKLSATSPVSVDIWSGFVERIEPSVERGRAPTATLYAVGPLQKIAATKITSSNAAALSGTIIGKILDAQGWPAGAGYRTIDAGQTTTAAWSVTNKGALEALREVEDTEMGFIVEGKDGKIIFEDRWSRLANMTPAAYYTDAATVGVNLLTNSGFESNTTGWTPVNAMSLERVTYWSRPGGIASGHVQMGAGSGYIYQPFTPTSSTKHTVALYVLGSDLLPLKLDITDNAGNAVSSSVDIVSSASWVRYSVTSTAALTSGSTYRIRLLALSGNDGLNAFVDDAQAEPGESAGTYVFTDGAAKSSFGYSKIAENDPLKEIFNEVTVASPAASASDSTSQSVYGKRTYQVPAVWLPSASVADDYCKFVVGSYKSPRPSLSVEFPSWASSALLIDMLSRDISDRVSFVSADLGIDRNFFIEAIAHRMAVGAGMQTTFELSPVSSLPAWTLGLSVLGTDTYLGY